MKRAVAAFLAGGMIVSTAHAAPRAESALECGVAADMAVVAHSLAHEHIDRQRADAIMGRIYDVTESDRGKQLMHDIMDAAYRVLDGGIAAPQAGDSANSGGSASSSGQQFAENLFATCMSTGGDMDTVLGQRS